MHRAPVILFLAAVLAALCSLPVQALTLTEAQTLSKPEIITKVFGEFGYLIADVDRPSGQNPWPTAEARSRLTSVNFYLKPHLAEASGLCGSQIVTVAFDTAGHPSGYFSTQTFGSPDLLSKPLQEGASAAERDSYSQSEQNVCRKVGNPARFFLAPNATVAARAILTVREIEEQAHLNRDPTFSFSWKSIFYKCSEESSRNQFLRTLSEMNISRSTLIGCQDNKIIADPVTLPDTACMEININENAVSLDELYVIESRSHDRWRIESVAVSINVMKIQ